MGNKDFDAQHMTTEHIQALLLEFEWGALWRWCSEESNTPIAKAIKAMLLAAWWQDYDAAKMELQLLENSREDSALFLFCCAYAFMAIGDVKEYRMIAARLKNKSCLWMLEWLDIECYGRMLKFDEQALYIKKKFLDVGRRPGAHVYVALIQTLIGKRAKKDCIAKCFDVFVKDDCVSSVPEKAFFKYFINCSDADRVPESPIELYCHAYWLLKNGRGKEALCVFDKLANEGLLDVCSVMAWLSLSISYPQGREFLTQRIAHAHKLSPQTAYCQGPIASVGLIYFWENQNYKLAHEYSQRYSSCRVAMGGDSMKASKAFLDYSIRLCYFWQQNRNLYESVKRAKTLYVFGESHSLSLSNAMFKFCDDVYRGKSEFVQGIKMYHLANPGTSYYSECLVEHISRIEDGQSYLFAIGEIDSRPDEGIWKASVLRGIFDYRQTVIETVDGYIQFLARQLINKSPESIIVQGVPAPGYKLDKYLDGLSKPRFLEMIRFVNDRLKLKALEAGFFFLDVYSATVGEGGVSNGRWHIDNHHISPAFYVEASDWLVIPATSPRN